MSFFGLFHSKKDTKETKAPAQASHQADSVPDHHDSAGAITPKEIQHFLPIRLLPERIIAYLATRANTTLHPPGSPISKPDPNQEASYLLSGSIEFRQSGAPSQQISAKDTKAAFPLHFPIAEEEICFATSDTTLIHLPADLIKSAEQISPEALPYDGLLDQDETPPPYFTELSERLQEDDIQLPSPPDLGVRIGRTIDNPRTSAEDVAKIIQLDPALTARLIQVANSPLYGGLDKVESCQNAVSRLGMVTTRNLVISFLLKNLFRSDSKVLQHAMDDIWRESTRVAALSSILSGLTPNLDSGRALLAGLIHKIGAIAIINDAKLHPDLKNNREALMAAIDQSGADIAAIILEKWNFGDDLVEVVTKSSDWMRDESSEPCYADLVMVSRLHAYVGSPKMRSLPRIDLVPAFHKLGVGRLSPKLSIAVLDKAEKDIRAVEQLLRA